MVSRSIRELTRLVSRGNSNSSTGLVTKHKILVILCATSCSDVHGGAGVDHLQPRHGTPNISVPVKSTLIYGDSSENTNSNPKLSGGAG